MHDWLIIFRTNEAINHLDYLSCTYFYNWAKALGEAVISVRLYALMLLIFIYRLD